ncbi:hypothetical protein L226DRAFT_245086 [Lentinus tigrinus ALCF2SS1-7]|uniref:uncharacterized protein n=1 Tax=Lentinus tigrinus ALCF2SS1-7 TaxID=1328758 RepID=UPI0011662474|nr:hypothetical protein L226DRAFT_245086 [Lentinus tigrinus ALCF2SS1-7]
MMTEIPLSLEKALADSFPPSATLTPTVPPFPSPTWSPSSTASELSLSGSPASQRLPPIDGLGHESRPESDLHADLENLFTRRKIFGYRIFTRELHIRWDDGHDYLPITICAVFVLRSDHSESWGLQALGVGQVRTDQAAESARLNMDYRAGEIFSADLEFSVRRGHPGWDETEEAPLQIVFSVDRRRDFVLQVHLRVGQSVQLLAIMDFEPAGA